MDYSNEEWKPVVGYEGYYEVSNLGRVKRFNRRILKPYVITSKYFAVTLSVRNKFKTVMIHILVSNAFIRVCPEGMERNHKDGNKLNNHVDNLELVTRSENVRHAEALGLKPVGSKIAWAKLDEEKVKQIRLMKKGVVSSEFIERKFGISASLVSDVRLGKKWKHVPL